MTLLDLLGRLESTPLALWIQGSAYGFPLVVGLHILGLALAVGTLLWVDLRLLGLALRDLPVSTVYRGLAPWFLAGFAVTLLSGAALFAAYATAAYGNLYFRIKMAALLFAGVNALVFHFAARSTSPTADAQALPPRSMRLAGALSIVFWTIVLVCGRWISYTLFSFPSP